MTLMLRWRAIERPLVLRWRGPDWAAEAVPQGAAAVDLATIVGPPGRDGADLSSTDLAMIAAAPIGGHRAVAVDASGQVIHADPAVAAAGFPVIGVSLGAAAAGGAVTVRTASTIDEPSWNWAPGFVFLAAAGVLTQTLPTSGSITVVGTAIGPQRLHVAPWLVARIS